jgi:hypothetical protein
MLTPVRVGHEVGNGQATKQEGWTTRQKEARCAKEKCDGYYETRQREIPPGSGNFIPFTAYWVPMAYPDGVDDLPVLNRAGCITTVLAGGNVEPVPYAALSTTAINAQCNEAKNRSDCIYFLRQFHLGTLAPGPG